jgi:hypothetical protein
MTFATILQLILGAAPVLTQDILNVIKAIESADKTTTGTPVSDALAAHVVK